MTKKNKKQQIQHAYLQDQAIKNLFEFEIDKLIKNNRTVSKSALKQSPDLAHSMVESVYPYYATSKNARIELNCSIVDKKTWQHKAKQADTTVSQLAIESLNRVQIKIPFTKKLQAELNAVALERVRFNSLLNQLARWCNTHKSGIETVQVLAELNYLQKQFDDHDLRMMQIFAQPCDHYLYEYPTKDGWRLYRCH
ncbi:hypothetical protein [Vibrio coralliirubri]|uniref:hypothetical protein n=1 Tax=Vibrio coralliirubri TaxID=1516159 RepID=UPI000630E34A|nr:hypothetical protein [Vibrio coralliirubri]CDU08799.1 conserved hypothetical protein [Vibrio coralliirubri]